MDQRQQVIDRIAAIVPIRETNRENGQIALVTTGGAILVDGGRLATFGFTPVGVVTPDMTISSGALSGLTMNGKPVRFGEGTEAMDGGSLAADFRLRDRDAPTIQAQLDAVARDLIARVADTGVDPTLGPTTAGLLTDGGAPLDPANETGLSLRISVNSAVDPMQGGALWRLRSGIGATAEGPPGQSSILEALREALVTPVNPASGGFAPGERSAAGLTSDLLSNISQARVRAESDQSFASSRYDSLRKDELALGVDTDQQTEILFQIERSYAANAKVVSAVDEMLKILLGM
jgi:flagellar hook-associated protein 1 FlgK